ncbi:MAG: ABC transporter ATP-binding protein [Bacteroidota bacterium]
MDLVLEIRHLACAYLPGKTVLDIEALDIPYGRLVFIIGRSGIGKSTFIETLGLMSQTIVPAERSHIRFYPRGASAEPIELKDSWQLPNADLAQLRRQYFSFIFQQTNLMPNFSAGENMMVSRLIEGAGMAQVKEEVMEVMGKLSLEAALFDKKISHLSGGQRQRLAFVRAITADFTILFGDEPTGNLDRHTAEELMTVLKQQIARQGRTGIIVSHDLPLAAQFADLIVPITPRWDGAGEVSGQLRAQDILRRDGDRWRDAEGKTIDRVVDHLSKFLQ